MAKVEIVGQEVIRENGESGWTEELHIEILGPINERERRINGVEKAVRNLGKIINMFVFGKEEVK